MSSGINDKGVLSYIGSVGGVSGSGGGTRARGGGGTDSWFKAMAQAWGDTLDKQANKVIQLSNELGDGVNNPSQAALLTASAQEMAFLSQSAATSINATAEAIKAISRKE